MVIGSVKQKVLNSPLNYRIFNNTLSPKLNLKYLLHLKRCQNNSVEKYNRDKEIVAAIKNKGAIHLKSILEEKVAKDISDTITRFVDEGRNLRKEEGNECYIGIEKPVTNLSDELIKVFENKLLDETIKGFFGSNYRVQWLDCYRTFPACNVMQSWLWHSDNVPCGTLKMMLLLTEAHEDKGATTFLSPEDTMMYRNKGYMGTNVSTRVLDLKPFAEKNDLPYRPYCNVTLPGDVLLFDNNNLHKAVPPKEGFRDVLTYLLLPSEISWQEDLTRRGIEQIEDNPGGYPIAL